MNLLVLMLFACGALMGLAGSFSIVSNAMARDKRRRAHMARALGRAKAAEPAPVRRPLTGRPEPAARMVRLARLINYNPEIPEQYPVKWQVVLLAALLPARGVAWLVATLAGGWATLLMPVFWLMLVRIYFGGCARKMRKTLFQQFPDALAMLVRSVRVGVPVAEGIRVASRESPEPTASIFGRVASELSIGVSIDDALRSVTRRYALPEYRFFATALALQSQTGGGLSETLENLADTIRKRVAAQSKGKALAAEARLSSGVLAALPVLTAGGLALLSPGYIQQLVTDPHGKYIIAAAVCTEGLGLFSMQFLIQKALS